MLVLRFGAFSSRVNVAYGTGEFFIIAAEFLDGCDHFVFGRNPFLIIHPKGPPHIF
jgi:hypothetical protein